LVVVANILSGLVIGLVFGIALQRGRFCFNSAFRDTLMFKDYTIIKAIGVAIAVEMVGFQLLSDLGLVQLYPRGFYWGANILGGFMFGVGMVIAGGCISGATYRTGEGMVGSMLALVGIAIGAASTLNYSLAPIKDLLQNATKIQIKGLSPTIPLVLGVSPWVLIIPVFALFLFSAQRSYRRERKAKSDPISLFGQSWPWWFSGIIVGVVAVISYPVAETAGRTTPLAMTGGYVGILAIFVNQDIQYMGWEQAMVIGAIFGAGIAALLAREWKVRVPPAKMLAQSLLGGLVMGVGAVLGDGCNITTILIGVPLLSLGGILAGTFTILGCWTAAYMLFR
jgi:uncharacterized membrane protein YedE/YeeE